MNETGLPVTPATVKASTPTAVETSAAVKSAAEARLPARGKPSRDSSMIKAAERAGMTTGLDMRRPKSPLGSYKSMLRGGSMEPRISTRAPALKSASTMKSAAMIEVPGRAIERVVIGEDSAVGDVGVVVEDDSVAMPIISPVVPAPAEAAEEADAIAEAKRNSRSGKIQPWIPIPTWPDPDRPSIHEPGIIFRQINNLRIGRLDHDRLSLLGHGLL